MLNNIRIEILNPKAKKLLKNLEELSLISIKEEEDSDFESVLEKLRKNAKVKGELSLEEITKEVEIVRTKRYAKKR